MEWNAHQSDWVPKASQEWRREILEMGGNIYKAWHRRPLPNPPPRNTEKDVNREACVCIRLDLERRASSGAEGGRGCSLIDVWIY